VSSSRRFDEPLLLPDGRKHRTVREAINWLAKEICVTQAAVHGGPMLFAQMGMLQAIHRQQSSAVVMRWKDLPTRATSSDRLRHSRST